MGTELRSAMVMSVPAGKQGGGVMMMMHLPPEHPLTQRVSVGTYEQRPWEHVPLDAYRRRVSESTQTVAGGLLHVTPVQGSLWHAPFEQPNVHVVSVGA
jgi:hypothetical protein